MDVEFNDPTYTGKRTVPTGAPASGLERIVCNLGFAKTAKGAQQVLIVTTLFCIIASLSAIWFEVLSKPPVPHPPVGGLSGRV